MSTNTVMHYLVFMNTITGKNYNNIMVHIKKSNNIIPTILM